MALTPLRIGTDASLQLEAEGDRPPIFKRRRGAGEHEAVAARFDPDGVDERFIRHDIAASSELPQVSGRAFSEAAPPPLCPGMEPST